MRKFALAIWLMLPVLVGAYHYGPGQAQLKLDQVSNLLSKADGLVGQQKWTEAVDVYESALGLLPKGHDEVRQRVRLERAKAMMFCSELPAANSDGKLPSDTFSTCTASHSCPFDECTVDKTR